MRLRPAAKSFLLNSPSQEVETDAVTPIETKIEELLEESEHFGEERLSNGVRLVRPAPEIAPKAWSHIVFPPIGERALAELESLLFQTFPAELRQFYGSFNGISLFGGGLTIWGKRQDYTRQGQGMWQPFDIVSHNAAADRPRNSPYRVLYFGSTDRGSNRLYIDVQSSEVGKTPAGLYVADTTWASFNIFFLSEFERQSSIIP